MENYNFSEKIILLIFLFFDVVFILKINLTNHENNYIKFDYFIIKPMKIYA